MAVDFDFDTDYNEDAEDDSGEEFDPEEEDFDDEEYEDEAEDDDGGRRSSPLRIILLALVVLVLLCVVCWLASSFVSLPIPGIPGFGAEEAATPAPVAQDTPVPDEGDGQQPGDADADQQPGDATPEDATTEAPAGSEEAPGDEATVTTDSASDAAGEGGEGTEVEGDASAQPTEEPTEEPTQEPTDEPNVVAGPTATPGGDGSAAAACDANMPPSASTGGPYVVTKGLTIVTLDASGSTDPDGNIESYEWDFGDGESGSGQTAIHEYKREGSFQVTLKVTDNCGESHVATTNVVISAEDGAAGGEAGQGQGAASCDENTPPVADAGGPYDGMMGKGTAIITFNGSGSSDSDGTIVGYEWDFGDGETGEGETAVHRYTETGSFQATLIVTDNCGDTDEATADVTISGPTPPAETETPEATPATPVATATPTATPDNGGWVPPPVDPSLGTAGFCYKVQHGDTLYGIGVRFGVTVQQLAFVNGVSPNYYVKTGEGFFIPTGPIAPQGPNIYQARPGDTISSVAYQCGVPAEELGWVNGLSADSVLSPGQIVKIPPPWSY